MTERMKYEILLRSLDGSVVGESEADTLKDAKAKARYMVSDEYARNTESTHDDTDKAEVRDKNGACLFDVFRRR